MFEFTLIFRQKSQNSETRAENSGLLSTGVYNIWAWKWLFPVWNRLDLRSWKFHGETIITSYFMRY